VAQVEVVTAAARLAHQTLVVVAEEVLFLVLVDMPVTLAE
jgi:hypothetical protein